MDARTGWGNGAPGLPRTRGKGLGASWLVPLLALGWLVAGSAWAEGFEIIDLEDTQVQPLESEPDLQPQPLTYAPDAQPEPVSAAPMAPPELAPAPVAVKARHSTGLPILVMDSGLPRQRLPERADEAAVAMPLPEQAPPPLPAKDGDEPVIKLGVGDQVNVKVFGRPEFDTTTYVADDGTINVPLAGPVDVGGKSPSGAAMSVARALKSGQFLVNPQVSITLPQFKSQQVSVLGEVRNPGRYPLDSKTTLLDLLAQAGGVAETGSTTIYLIRGNADGKPERRAVDLLGLASGKGDLPDVRIRSGDSVFVPRAQQYYVYGEVQNPNMYPLQPGTTVLQAISRSGGLTPRGSDSRIVIKRKDKNGKYRNFDADLTDRVEADDVIRVKERIF